MNLLERYNLINTVHTPTRITKSTSSLIDLMVINGNRYNKPAFNLELGLSDHLAQLLPVMCNEPKSGKPKIRRRSFNSQNMLQFTSLLDKITWHEVTTAPEVNIKFERFMSKLSATYNTAFPLTQTPMRIPKTATWITQGIRNSSKKIRLFNKLKKYTTLTEGTRQQITKYTSIYKRIINVAKRRENDRLISHATNKSKAVWKIINKEFGRQHASQYGITLSNLTTEVTNLNIIANLFNNHFCNMPAKLRNYNT
jgi:hypothetical protein